MISTWQKKQYYLFDDYQLVLTVKKYMYLWLNLY
jgi:hypothetical protein